MFGWYIEPHFYERDKWTPDDLLFMQRWPWPPTPGPGMTETRAFSILADARMDTELGTEQIYARVEFYPSYTFGPLRQRVTTNVVEHIDAG